VRGLALHPRVLPLKLFHEESPSHVAPILPRMGDTLNP
jgi:hypothetical protein